MCSSVSRDDSPRFLCAWRLACEATEEVAGRFACARNVRPHSILEIEVSSPSLPLSCVRACLNLSYNKGSKHSHK